MRRRLPQLQESGLIPGSDGALAAIQSRLAADPAVLFAMLFGPRASGSPRADSDWDLAVVPDPSLDGPSRASKHAHLIAGLEPECRVDLVVLNDAPPLVAHPALCGERLSSAINLLTCASSYTRSRSPSTSRSGTSSTQRRDAAGWRKGRLVAHDAFLADRG